MHVFDIKKPHGVIYGHPVARFDQNGVLYDGSGREVPKERMEEIEELAQIANEVEEKRKMDEMIKANPSAKKRGRPPGAKNRAKQVEA